MKQKYLFLETEGNRWLERNRDAMAKLAENGDPVIDAIVTADIKPKRVLEIGCSVGWRLSLLREKYGCEIMGVEPSREACIEAAARRVPAVQSTASSPGVSSQFDLVIYGFCLYLTDPDDWLQIAAEGNCLLSPGGYLIIHDFASSPSLPYARRYEHRDGVLSYHIDFAKLWLGSPLYTVVMRTIDGDGMVTVLKKLPANSIKVLP